MDRIRPELKNEAETALGDAPEEEYTFLLVPVGVYSLVSKTARQEGCSVGEVFQKALLQYLQATQAGEKKAVDSPPRPTPTMVVKRKR